MNFSLLKTAVQKHFLKMQDKPLFRVAVDGDLLWKTYLESFPKGSDPILRKRSEHDCSCCRHFIRNAGKIVTVENGKLVSIWNVTVSEPAYQTVADAMSHFVKSRQIENVYLSSEGTVGTDKNFEAILGGDVQTYDHFFLRLPTSAIVPKGKIGEREGIARSAFDVFLRALTETGLEEIDTVLDLINQNSLYRGEEHKAMLEQFRARKASFIKTTRETYPLFVWSVLSSTMPSVAHIRNSSIGTLLVDLAEGKELDDAVKSYEAKVAPANYKRPTALVTKAMIEKAKKTVEELGLTSALERRYAALEDVSIRDLLFADRSVKKVLTGNVFDEITPTKTSVHKTSKVEEIGIEEFLSSVLPSATSLEVYVANDHLPKLVSLIAPCDPSAKRLFKWDNLFSWSYAGDFADSIKERVKTAGGKVDGDLRCSLSWNNYDDLDLHMTEPDGTHIYYGSRRSDAGFLDVDMNAGSGHTRTPVENICYPARGRMPDGIYVLAVNQFRKRESENTGFEVEIEFDGVVHTFAHPKALRQGETVTVAKIKYRDGHFEIIESIPSTERTKEAWGIRTQNFVPVTAVMLSPNYWGDKGVGNKHYFFMLKGCVRDGAARGFYNEFLTGELDKHRKVLEMVGSKMKTTESAEQMSGLGFSSTQRASIMVRVKGSFTRTLVVKF